LLPSFRILDGAIRQQLDNAEAQALHLMRENAFIALRATILSHPVKDWTSPPDA
jgi:hypothetical protein